VNALETREGLELRVRIAIATGFVVAGNTVGEGASDASAEVIFLSCRTHTTRASACRSANCGGRLQIIAAIVDPAVIAQILTHLHLPARAPPRSPARRVDLFQAA